VILPALYPPSRTVVAMLRWVGLALLGIVVAIVVAIVASRLASQQIGLASEPVSAGDSLAPAAERTTSGTAPRHGRRAHSQRQSHSPESTPPEETAPIVPPPPETSPPYEPPVSGGDDSAEPSGGGADD